MAKIIWVFRVRNEEVFHRVKVDRHVLHKIKRRRTNWISHKLRTNCLLKRFIGGKIEGRIEVTERGERSCKQYSMNLRKGESIGK